VALSDTQKGVCAEYEFQKLVLMGGRGKLEPAPPAADDDGVDTHIHLRDVFTVSVAFQIKCSVKLTCHFNANRLAIRILIPRHRVKSHPLFWYIFAHLDSKLMRFSDPVFMVPSKVVYRIAFNTAVGKDRLFSFLASMEPGSRDKWAQYRVSPLKIGERVLQIVKEAQAGGLRSPEPLLGRPDLVWVGAHRGTG
jgi:hypothetical protein